MNSSRLSVDYEANYVSGVDEVNIIGGDCLKLVFRGCVKRRTSKFKAAKIARSHEYEMIFL